MSYQDEDAIKAELRDLTKRTRKLRQELSALVKSGPAKDLTRGRLHVGGARNPSALTSDDEQSVARDPADGPRPPIDKG